VHPSTRWALPAARFRCSGGTGPRHGSQEGRVPQGRVTRCCGCPDAMLPLVVYGGEGWRRGGSTLCVAGAHEAHEVLGYERTGSLLRLPGSRIGVRDRRVFQAVMWLVLIQTWSTQRAGYSTMRRRADPVSAPVALGRLQVQGRAGYGCPGAAQCFPREDDAVPGTCEEPSGGKGRHEGYAETLLAS